MITIQGLFLFIDRVQQMSNPPLHPTDDLQSCLYVNGMV